MRLIDADELFKTFKNRQIESLNWKECAILADNEESIIRADATLAFLVEVKSIIDNAPTVEIPNYGGQVVPDTLQGWRYEERPHGEWITRYDTEWHFECNQCKGLSPWKAQFCGVCGADMRGDKK